MSKKIFVAQKPGENPTFDSLEIDKDIEEKLVKIYKDNGYIVNLIDDAPEILTSR